MTQINEKPVTSANVDLSNCDREQIQYSGAIQPHGILLTFEEPELRVLQASANAAALFNLPLDDIFQRTAADLFGHAIAGTLQERLKEESLDRAPVHLLRIHLPPGRGFHAFGHRIDGVLVLELESAAQADPKTLDHYSQLRSAIDKLQSTTNLEEFMDLAVQQIRRFTGFDRVMAYKFLPDGSGDVTAESLEPGLQPYLGLRYPASDIPQPARRLFSLTWLRHLPAVYYEPVPILPAVNPVTNGPLDLSYAFTRHLSVMYTGYLKNMGVQATMVMTLLKKGELWGLISCMHHQEPKHVPYETRMACEFLAHMVSLLLDSKEDIGNYRYKLKLAATWDQLTENMSRQEDFRDALTGMEPNILTGINAGGAAVVVHGEVRLLGRTPPEEQVLRLTEWASSQADTIFHTDSLPSQYPGAEAYKDTAAGVLGIRLARKHHDMILWFRPEQAQTVNWAGNPEKPVEVSFEGDELRLTPRRSFELWRQSVSGRSAPWQPWEIEAAADLRRNIVDIILQQAAAMAGLNQQLSESNLDLESFAYVAAHDLKEPLRGITHYSAMLLRSNTGQLDAKGQERLRLVQTLVSRMDMLINSLLEYSRVGRTGLQRTPVDLNECVTRVLATLRRRIEETGLEPRVPRRLPVLHCDSVRVEEVLQNLISNAAKYNDKPKPWVEIGYLDGKPAVFYVKDNGIGIDPSANEEIFQIFRRLHGKAEFGGGASAGLTITRRIVQRHGGRIWVDSLPGQGSTFYFTLEPEESHETTPDTAHRDHR